MNDVGQSRRESHCFPTRLLNRYYEWYRKRGSLRDELPSFYFHICSIQRWYKYKWKIAKENCGRSLNLSLKTTSHTSWAVKCEQQLLHQEGTYDTNTERLRAGKSLPLWISVCTGASTEQYVSSSSDQEPYLALADKQKTFRGMKLDRYN